MRRIVAIVIVSFLAIGLFGCQQDSPSSPIAGTTTTGNTVYSQQENLTTTGQGSADPVGTTTIGKGTTTETKESLWTTTVVTQKSTQVSVTTSTEPSTTTTSTKAGSMVETTTTRISTTNKTTVQTTATTTSNVTIQSVTTTTETTISFSAAVTQSTVSTKPEAITPLTALDPQEYYGYGLLGKEDNGSQLQEAYRRIVASVEDMETTIAINGDAVRLTGEELIHVWQYYRLDYPQHFWVDGKFSYEITGDLLDAKPTYRMNKQDRDTRRAAMEKTVSEILSKVSGSWSAYKRELVIHDALCGRLTYQDTGKAAHNADGALVDGIAVCEGYAESFQYLLYRAGVPCVSVIGSSKNQEHKWNAVYLDGQYYFVDITWDDPMGAQPTIWHQYFNVSTALLQRDHRIDQQEGYPVPACNGTAYNYFKQNGGWITEFSVDTVAAHIRHNNGKAEFYIVDKSANEFVDWFQENAPAIAKKAGTGLQYSMSIGNYGVIVTMK